jgi:hypothetical protein
MTQMAKLANSTTGVVDFGGKFATGVNDTDSKFATGVNDINICESRENVCLDFVNYSLKKENFSALWRYMALNTIDDSLCS